MTETINANSIVMEDSEVEIRTVNGVPINNNDMALNIRVQNLEARLDMLLESQARLLQAVCRDKQPETIATPSSAGSDTVENIIIPPSEITRHKPNSFVKNITNTCLASILPAHFNGEGGSSPTEFIRGFETLVNLQDFSFPDINLIITATLKGRAGRWFAEKGRSFQTSSQFIAAFKEEFISRQFIQGIEAKIAGERQGNQEKIIPYFDRLSKLNAELPNPLTDNEIIRISLRGVRRDISVHMGDKDYYTMGQLYAEAARLDAIIDPPIRDQRSSSLFSGEGRKKGYVNSRGNDYDSRRTYINKVDFVFMSTTVPSYETLLWGHLELAIDNFGASSCDFMFRKFTSS